MQLLEGGNMEKVEIIRSVLGMVGALTPFLALGAWGTKNRRSLVPLPPELNNLPTIKAEPWLLVEDNPDIILEGPAFDRHGNLFVSSVFDSRVLRIAPDKKVETILHEPGLLPDGIAIHKDGRLFMACLSGRVVHVKPDGTNLTDIAVKHNGRPASANDLVFDGNGNLYVTDFTGTVADPTGGVYRFSADMTRIDQVIGNLASANGIGIAPEGNVLWVSETGRNDILRIELLKDGVNINPIVGVQIPQRFSGGPGGADSLKIDAHGNVYQCMIFQGRAVVLNRTGIPIANVVIPGRENRKHLVTPNLAFKPGTDEAYIAAGGEGGAWIYRFRGLAKGLTLYSHQ
jgi:lactonase